jgi:glycosyltransferase involved in cell wall biosynthesis
MGQKVYFHPHLHLRDRQLDTVRRWPREDVVNPEILDRASVTQANAENARKGRIPVNWKQRIPLANIKVRPKRLPNDVAVYHWGAIAHQGKFILDLDNPYALVGYNLKAMPLWRPILKRVLLSDRCIEIRCLSEACRSTLKILFGERVWQKARVKYPRFEKQVTNPSVHGDEGPRFLFIGTQFEIKGGRALLSAFKQVHAEHPSATLDMITHLPEQYADDVKTIAGLTVHDAKFTRAEIWSRFMQNSDVLVLPTYVESFGMVALEALAHGLAVIATDVYALAELVQNGENGYLIEPPLSVWSGVLPSPLHYALDKVSDVAASTDTSEFEHKLAQSMLFICQNPDGLLQMRQASTKLFDSRFSGPAQS